VADSPLMLSVSGMRGVVGGSLTPAVVTRFAEAYASWLIASRKADGIDAPPHVLVGRDSRESGPMCDMAATAGLLAAGCRVTRLGVQSTPTVAAAVRGLSADGGLIVTASHNPRPWNGVKPLRPDGSSLPADAAAAVIERFEADDADRVPVEALRRVVELPEHPEGDWPAVIELHVEAVARIVDVEAIRKAKLSAVVDSVHGAGGLAANALLRRLGVKLDHLYAEPTGVFPHPPEPTAANCGELCDRVPFAGADVGFIQDTDADRLAIADEQGRYIGEEYTLALAAKALLGRGGVVAANLSTSRMIDDVAAEVGGRVVRTPVGEANVADAMRPHDATLGGEGNGGIIHPAVSYTRDSLVGMAVILEMLAKTGKPLSGLVAELPAYAIAKTKADRGGLDPAALEPKLRAAFADAAVDTQDGVRLDWEDRWLHVRPSNTEPVIRLIAEAPTAADADRLIADASKALGL